MERYKDQVGIKTPDHVKEEVIRLEERGLTYKEIEDKVGVTRERARQIVAKSRQARNTARYEQRLRKKKAMWLREKGLTNREIGQHFGVTPERARQMIRSGKINMESGLRNALWQCARSTSYPGFADWLEKEAGQCTQKPAE